MIRAFFLAMGIFVFILGVEFMVLDKAVIMTEAEPVAGAPVGAPVVMRARDIRPPEWAPWMLLSAGVVVVLYSFTIPNRSSA